MRVLVINPGSSTLKASFVDGSRDAGGVTVEWPTGEADAQAVLRTAITQLPGGADAVGYRVVHGGEAYRVPTRVDDQLLTTVERLDALAPLHNRRAAAVMRAGRDALPELPHIACFDTAFHATLPEEAWRYPLPEDWVASRGIRRFGFHGISVAWATRRSAELLGRPPGELRLVVAHLGSGCSVTAVDGGRSVDTSMGLTPYEGLMMGTRSGSIDPGIILQLLGDGVSPVDLAAGLAQRSGLLAVGGSADVRQLESRAARGDAPARMALAMFARRAAAAIAATATAMPLLDALAFTGGIGEGSAAVRRDIVRRLGSLGFDDRLGAAEGDAVIGTGPPAVLVVRAREDRVIADEVASVLRPDQSHPDA